MNDSAVRSARFAVITVSGFLDADNKFHEDQEKALRSEIDRLGSHLSKHYINGNMSEGLITHRDDLIKLLQMWDSIQADKNKELDTMVQMYERHSEGFIPETQV